MALIATALGGCGTAGAGTMPCGTIGPVVEFEVEDQENPVIQNFSPPPGTVIERTQFIAFDVVDNSGKFAIVFVMARFPDGSCECVWDGSTFAPRYGAGSSRVLIDCGFRYTVRRTGGWLSTPLTIEARAVDAAGNREDGGADFL